MAANPAKALEPENSGEQPMGANSTQAVAIFFLLIAFTLLAGGLAGGGIVVWLGGVVLLGVSAFFFLKCKPWENQNE